MKTLQGDTCAQALFYAFAASHTKDLVLDNGKLIFSNDAVHAEFVKRLESSEALHRRFQRRVQASIAAQKRLRAAAGLDKLGIIWLLPDCTQVRESGDVLRGGESG